MVSTRPKNKLRGIPTRIKIDLIGENSTSPKPKPKHKPSSQKPIPMETTPTPSGKTPPTIESPSLVDEQTIDQLTAEIEVPTLGIKELHAAKEAETPTPTAAEKGGEASANKKPPASASKRKKPTAEKSTTPAEGSSTEKNEPSGSVLQEEQGESSEDAEEAPAKRRKKVIDASPLRMIKGEPAFAGRSRRKAAEPLGQKGIAVPKIPDLESLSRLGMVEKIKEYFNNIGWGPFLNWPNHAYEEIVREMFDSIQVEINQTCGPLGMSFTLKGETRDVSINELNLNLGMIHLKDLQKKEYKLAKKGVPFFEAQEWDVMWGDIGDEGVFVTQKTKGHRIRDPALRVCHRILSYAMFGKKDSGNAMSKKDLYIL